MPALHLPGRRELYRRPLPGARLGLQVHPAPRHRRAELSSALWWQWQQWGPSARERRQARPGASPPRQQVNARGSVAKAFPHGGPSDLDPMRQQIRRADSCLAPCARGVLCAWQRQPDARWDLTQGYNPQHHGPACLHA